MPTPLLVANWKMNNPPAGFDAAESPYRSNANATVMVCPTSLHVRECVTAGLQTVGQAGRAEVSGAFTGDVSMTMLKAAGCEVVLCGHSERRQGHGESDAQIIAQAVAALAAGLRPIVCCGERSGEDRTEVLKRQLSGLPTDADVILAYEPVWAIGTGQAATPIDVADAVRILRTVCGFASQPILYGGSVQPDNARSFLDVPGVGGLLVGGAALKPDVWRQLVAVA